jgi:predicted HicB family RNase H-like nuclease
MSNKTVTLRMPEELHEQIRAEAQKAGVGLSWLIRQMFTYVLGEGKAGFTKKMKNRFG